LAVIEKNIQPHLEDFQSKIANVLTKTYPLSSQAIDLMMPVFKFKRLEKMEHVIRHNSLNYMEYILVEGIC